MPKRKRESRVKYLFVLMFVFILLAILAVMRSFPSTQTIKPKASEYLDVKPIPGGSLGTFSNNRTVLIYLIGLNVTAKKNATSILIQMPYYTASPDYQYAFKESLTAGESWQVMGGGEGSQPVISSYPARSILNDDGYFPVKIGISCAEAEHEYIYVYLRPEDILSMEGPG
jgi:hypothetical protein